MDRSREDAPRDEREHHRPRRGDEEGRAEVRRERRRESSDSPTRSLKNEQRLNPRRDSRDRERSERPRRTQKDDSRERRHRSGRDEDVSSRRGEHRRPRDRHRDDDDDDDDEERSRERHRRRRDRHLDEHDNHDGDRSPRREAARREDRRRRDPPSRSRSPPSRRQRRASRSRSPTARDPPRSRRYDEDASRSPPPRRRHRTEHAEEDAEQRQQQYSKPPPSSSSSLIRSRAPLPSQNDSFRGDALHLPPAEGAPPPLPAKQKPNYKPTGLLAKEANTLHHPASSSSTAANDPGARSKTILKYHEPPEARLPSATAAPWRMYIFSSSSTSSASSDGYKSDADLPETLPLHTRSCWLFGRDALVADVHCAHASVSKQHAVVQFRRVVASTSSGMEFGGAGKMVVKPYVIDLESAQGTWLNGEKVPAGRFVELRSADVLRFGASKGEFLVMLPPGEGSS